MARTTAKSGPSGKPNSTPAKRSSAGTRTASTRASRSTRTTGTSATKKASEAGEAPSTPTAIEAPRAVDAVRRDLAEIAKRDKNLAQSALAAAAWSMADQLDDPGTSAHAKSLCARALLDLLNRMRDLLPPERKANALDELASRRATRTGSSRTTG